MRSRRAGTFQVILMAVGLAFVLRYGIQFVAGPQLRALHVDATTSFKLPWGLTFGRTALFVAIASYLVLGGIGAMLRFSSLGRQIRAVADNLDLAETTGIDTPPDHPGRLAPRRRPRRARGRALRRLRPRRS